MPVTVNIVEGGHVIEVRISDPWTTEELLAVQSVTRPHRASVDFPVHSLLNVRGTWNVPPGVLRGRHMPAFSSSSRGYIAVVGGGGLVRMMFDVVRRLVNFERVSYFQTDEEAWAFLRQLIAEEQKSPATEHQQSD